MGVVARHLVEGDGEDDTDEAGEHRPHVTVQDAEGRPEGQRQRVAAGEARLGHGVGQEVGRIELQVDETEEEEARHGDHGADPEAPVDALERRVGRVVGAGLDGVGGDDGAEDADAADEQREDDALVTEAREAEDHGRDDGDFVALEDVGGHTGAVAHVVAHVVGDGGGVARVVLGDVLLDLSDEVGAHVGSLGVDAAAHAHEECEQRAAEAEAEQGLIGLLTVDDEDERSAQEPEAVGEHACHGAGTVAELHGLTVRTGGGGGDAQVAAGGKPHADEANGPAEERPHEEGPRAAELEGQQAALRREEEQHRDDDDERAYLPELRCHVGVGAFAHGRGDGLHALGALVGGPDLLREQEGVEKTGDGDQQYDHERDDLELGVLGIAEEAEELEGVLRAVSGGLLGLTEHRQHDERAEE